MENPEDRALVVWLNQPFNTGYSRPILTKFKDKAQNDLVDFQVT